MTYLADPLVPELAAEPVEAVRQSYASAVDEQVDRQALPDPDDQSALVQATAELEEDRGDCPDFS
jgi:hypothetical protein